MYLRFGHKKYSLESLCGAGVGRVWGVESVQHTMHANVSFQHHILIMQRIAAAETTQTNDRSPGSFQTDGFGFMDGRQLKHASN